MRRAQLALLLTFGALRGAAAQALEQPNASLPLTEDCAASTGSGCALSLVSTRQLAKLRTHPDWPLRGANTQVGVLGLGIGILLLLLAIVSGICGSNSESLALAAQPRVLLPLGTGLTALGLLGLHFALQADFFVNPVQAWMLAGHSGTLGLLYPGRELVPWSSQRGYTAWNTGWLLVALLLSPAALVSLALGLLNALKLGASYVLLGGAAVLSFLIGSVLGFARFQASDSLSCLYIFCWKAPTNASGPAAGLISQVGTVVFLAGLVIALTCGLCVSSHRAGGSTAKLDITTLQRRHVLRRRMSALSLLVVIPLLCLVCGILPNTWEHMTRNANFLCNSGREHEVYASGGEAKRSCFANFAVQPFGRGSSERQDAFLASSHFKLGRLYVKLWADTVLYYGLLELLVLGGWLIAELPALERATSTSVCGKVTVGNLLLASCLVAFYVLFTVYWGHDHLYEGGKFNSPAAEHVGRTFGQLASATLGLLLLPAARNSPVLAAAGLSWESSLFLHIAGGSLFVATALAHALSMASSMAQRGHWRDALPFNLGGVVYPINVPGKPVDDWTICLMATVFWPSAMVFGVFPWLRRWNWELFKFTHHSFLVLVPMVLVHGTGSWYYVAPSAALWVADAVVRLTRCADRVEVQIAKAHGELAELRFAWPGQPHSPGMFAWLSCPQLSALEWHPFSLSSSPLEQLASVHIKCMDEGSWTWRLHSLLEQLPRPEDLLLHVEGPYGPRLPLERYRSMLLIAGGIGITPMRSTLRYVLQGGWKPESDESEDDSEETSTDGGDHEALQGRQELQSVHLVWVAASETLFQAFADMLDAGSELVPKLSLYCSRASAGSACPLGPVIAGRPDLAEILREEAELGMKSFVRVCGPPAMVEAVEQAVQLVGADNLDYEPWSFSL